MRKNVLNKAINSPKKSIKLFLCDVDSALTDSGIYYAESGDELREFSIHDGMRLRFSQVQDIKIGIITSENAKLVKNRAKKLKIDFLAQGK